MESGPGRELLSFWPGLRTWVPISAVLGPAYLPNIRRRFPAAGVLGCGWRHVFVCALGKREGPEEAEPSLSKCKVLTICLLHPEGRSVQGSGTETTCERFLVLQPLRTRLSFAVYQNLISQDFRVCVCTSTFSHLANVPPDRCCGRAR